MPAEPYAGAMTTSIAAVVRPRIAWVILAVAAAAASSVLASTSVHAGVPACSVLASSASSPVPAASTTAFFGENVTVSGTGFAPSGLIDVLGSFNGDVPGPIASGTADGAGNFTFSSTSFAIGTWEVIFNESDGCLDSATVVVSAAAPPPTPVSTNLPNAAMGEPAPSGRAAVMIGLAVVLLIGVAAMGARSRRRA